MLFKAIRKFDTIFVYTATNILQRRQSKKLSLQRLTRGLENMYIV